MYRNVLTLFSLSLILFLLSCAPRKVELPVYKYANIQEVLHSKNKVSKIDSELSIVYEKDGIRLKGDGILNISKNGDINLRIYYLGFLTFELVSENGVINNTPVIDRKSALTLAKGLKDCFFWWDLIDFDAEDKGDVYILKGKTRELWVDKKTVFPLRQTIFLADGRKLYIFYEKPIEKNEIWFPSKIRIENPTSSVTLKIKDISFNLGV